ncbi:helix-turn-helix domain-containing protein [Shinella curvata]|uniref:Helix-turn-helix domain-containing protein n=1 Tax=Shinella curvata TaxID=1817964 RepID=A0ABT8XBI4_9HYPH|nr:helix-turn-helix domain-containing protein [Shinella curvata]MCJ8054637.1 helix-turn-helix domain-containing protein [Shinella curvata]MDO6120968.1 helix-turn-helix domain-containing protein [Shinella curvata]
MHNDKVRPVYFFLTEDFSLLALTSSMTALRTANKILQRDFYSLQLVSENGGMIVSDCGVPVQTQAVDGGKIDDWNPALIALVVGSRSDMNANRKALAWARRALVKGSELAGIGQGALWLAEMGLLQGKRCAVHWERLPAATERFPDVTMCRAYHNSEGSIHTCAGQAASFDLFLQIISSDFDQSLAEQVSEAVLHCGPRGSLDQQPFSRERGLRRIASPLVPIVMYMEQNISEPLCLTEISKLAGLSRRQIERVFVKHLGETPMRHFCRLRMERAASLLINTALPIMEIAIAVGFTSHSHFARLYKNLYGCTPAETRAMAVAEGRPIGKNRPISVQLAA